MKRCSRCEAEKNLDEFAKSKVSKDGLQAWCKQCAKEYTRIRNGATGEKKRAEPKPMSDEERARRKEYYRQWEAANKEKRAADKREWLINNRDKINARSRELYASDVEKYRERHNATRAKKSDQYNARQRAWQKRNPEKAYELMFARLKQRRNATPKWLTKYDKALMAGIAANAMMLTAMTGVEHVVDHVVPLQSKLVCGLHVPNNLQIITRAENARKGNRHWPDMP